MTTLSWIARFSGGLIVVLIVAFALAQTPEPHFVVGMIALYGGLALAWRYPLAGGATTIAGWLLTGMSTDVPFLVPAAVGLLHVLTFRQKPVTPRPPKWLAAAAAILAILFLNEMLGMPPLLTPPLNGLTGTWRASPSTAITIRADNSVTGTIDGVPISFARATRNRSPFGKLIGWRTDYLIQGEHAGKRFTAPLNAEGVDLRGSLGNRAIHLIREN